MSAATSYDLPLPTSRGETPEGAYTYLDENGDPLFLVCRYPGKRFLQYRHTADGWAAGLEHTRRVLYQLPQIRAHLASNIRDPLYICDGEKDVHAVERAGGVATCCPGGMGNWTEDLVWPLSGARRVIIVADRDEGKGADQAAKLGALLAAVGVVPEYAQAAAGKDAHDHLTAGCELDDLEELELAPPTPVAAAASAGFTLSTVTARELCDEPDGDSGQLLGPLILSGGRTIIVGDTGEGKTTLTFQLVGAVLGGHGFLDWEGAGEGRALVVDLEQGRRSVKRALRDANLAGRDDVDLVLVPDGLSLDRDTAHLAELDRVLSEGAYTLVALDPYYKAHRAEEPNAERPIVDLMRTLDSLRSTYGFALILPAHPRKEPPGAGTVRRLTIHDIAGSGAVTRGAEVVIGIERVTHGHARLRFLKDREGDLPIGEALNLVYNKGAGFTRNPDDLKAARDYQRDVRSESLDGKWRTIREYMDALGAGDKAIRSALTSLVEAGELEHQIGPEGRTRTAKCWRIPGSSPVQMHLNAPDALGDFSGESESTASVLSPVRGKHNDEVPPPETALHPDSANADNNHERPPLDDTYADFGPPDDPDLG